MNESDRMALDYIEEMDPDSAEWVRYKFDELIEVLEWYKKEAVAMSKNYNVNDDAVLASVTVLSLDCGNRADTIIKKYKDE